MITLFYAPGACSLAVHIVLEWAGADYSAVRVDQHSAEYRLVNPAAAVPALRLESGLVLTQADAILHYVARRYPDADLLDKSSPEAVAELDRWGCFFTGDLHPAFFPIFTPGRYTVDIGDTAQAAVVEAGVALVQKQLSLLDQHLTGRTWITGGKRTIMDAYALPMLNWAEAKLPGGLSAHLSVQRHHRRMKADAAVLKVMAIESSADRA